jgi:oligopeptide/dipeptide ABC transporter ATP-binding protein
MVFQEPATALNPVMRIGDQVAEPLVVHDSLSWRSARERAIELLARVGIPTPEANAAAYPHLLSGGMRQRITIAMALACAPDILLADEPTTALDTVLQSQILALLRRLQHERDMAILFITHDLSLVETVADDVMVMYAGRIVERAPAARLVRAPRHPYASALWRASPVNYREGRRLYSIPGTTPRLPTAGCAFFDRCERHGPRCAREQPKLAHGVACFFPNDEPPDCHG